MLSKQELANIAIEGKRKIEDKELKWFKDKIFAIDRILLAEAKKGKRTAIIRFWTEAKALTVLCNHPVASDYYTTGNVYHLKQFTVVFKW